MLQEEVYVEKPQGFEVEYLKMHVYRLEKALYSFVVTMTNTLQNFAYTQILEPTVDHVIGCSIVTSWSVDAFKLPFWIKSVEVTCLHMLRPQQVH